MMEQLNLNLDKNTKLWLNLKITNYKYIMGLKAKIIKGYFKILL